MARIVIGIEDVSQSGGQERVIWHLCRRLAPRHEVTLLCYGAKDVPDDVKVATVRDPSRLPLYLRALWFIPRASRAAKRLDYDVLLSQGSNLWKPTHILAHTCHAERAVQRREVDWARKRPGPVERLSWWVRDGIRVWLERRIMRRCRGHVIAVGATLRRNLMQRHKLAEGDVLVAENGVDHGTFNPDLRERWRPDIRAELELTDDTFVLLFVGGRWEEKGLSLLIDALPLMERADSKLVVLGRGDEEAFGRYAEEQGVRDRVVFAGVTPHPERYYASADCFTFLSESEGLALVQFEAAACGLPLILAKREAPPGLIDEGVSGFAIAPDPAALAEKLDLLASGPGFCRRAGEASYRNSLNFTWDRQAEKLEAILFPEA